MDVGQWNVISIRETYPILRANAPSKLATEFAASQPFVCPAQRPSSLVGVAAAERTDPWKYRDFCSSIACVPGAGRREGVAGYEGFEAIRGRILLASSRVLCRCAPTTSLFSGSGPAFPQHPAQDRNSGGIRQRERERESVRE